MARRSNKARKRTRALPQGILEVTDKGYGFVSCAEGEFFIPQSKMAGAFPGDLVEIQPYSSRGAHSSQPAHTALVGRGFAGRRPEARIKRVIMHAHATVVGIYEVADPFGVVIPLDRSIQHDIFTLREEAPHVAHGDLVEVEMLEYPTRNQAATGRVIKVLGHQGDTGLEIDAIIADHGLETDFSDAALAEAEQASIDIDKALLNGYSDRRNAEIFTIDPVDARDFDDAVTCKFINGRYHLGVYIADVSTYVPYASSLDTDAKKRATSVYLPDRVLPMLPEKLSNDICSLVPHTDRLALAVEACVRKDGYVESYRVFPCVFCSKGRLSYEQAQELIDAPNAEEALQAFHNHPFPIAGTHLDVAAITSIQQQVKALDELARILEAKRRQAGSLDFERTEAKVVLDDEGHPIDIRFRKRTAATQAIEEAMILANQLVAQWLIDAEMPCVFRVHEEPDSAPLAHLYTVLSEIEGYEDIDKQRLIAGNPFELQKVLERSDGTSLQELVNMLVLRSMKRAVYKNIDEPHYGLALDHYCHFTSPIRRYPDLLVHRMVKQKLFGKTATFEAQKNELAWLAEHSLKMEREAEAASHEALETKLIEYLQDYIGRTFIGVICGVSTLGIYVRLENTAVGKIDASDLGVEAFAFDFERKRLTGQTTGKVYAIGQRLPVVIEEADPARRVLRFSKA